MRLVFLYGPPAVGKLTIARELADVTGFKLFHNHLSFDAVIAVFPRSSAAFWRLIQNFRRDVFAEVVAANLDLIYTFVYTRWDDGGQEVREMVEPIVAGGGELCLVKLTCARDELLRRVAEPSRQAYRKLNDSTRLAELLVERELTAPLPFGTSFELDTTDLPPRQAAERIAAHFGLPTAGEGSGQELGDGAA